MNRRAIIVRGAPVDYLGPWRFFLAVLVVMVTIVACAPLASKETSVQTQASMPIVSSFVDTASAQ